MKGLGHELMVELDNEYMYGVYFSVHYAFPSMYMYMFKISFSTIKEWT